MGLRLFFLWLEQDAMFLPVLKAIEKRIQEYKEENPEEEFRLLHAKTATIFEKWKALSMLPLLEVKKISELDYSQHNLSDVLDKNYSSSTLTQFLGELEKIDVGEDLKTLLSIENSVDGKYCYIDGHLFAYWTSSKKMHKGLITMLGRIMAGSKLVLAHNELGESIGFDYYPPDIHLSHIVEKFCGDIVDRTGINTFIIDREVNSVKTARLFIKNGWELICLLSANEYKGLESFNKKFAKRLSDGTVLYKASWKECREDDPRKFIIVEEKDRTIVYWGTPKIIEKLTSEESLQVYRGRSEIQENGIKRMIAHGALNTNYGTKTIAKQDRTHQRKIDKIDKKIEKSIAKEKRADLEITEQIQKVADSMCKKHEKLLESRRGKLRKCYQGKEEIQRKTEKILEEKNGLGKVGVREDRDFRKQSIMTFRTLWLENLLSIFVSLISKPIWGSKVGVEVVLQLFFRRSGIVEETASHIVYTFNFDSLSRKYQEVLHDLVNGFNSISPSYKGKPVVARIAGFT